MELSQLRYFVAVARHEHVTHAAEEMHIAQPALTKSIHKLEAELEVPLVMRQGRNIALTEYGRHLYQRLTEPLETLEQLPMELSSMARGEAQTLRLNVLSASTVVTQSVIRYQATHPKTRFIIVQNEETTGADISIDTFEALGFSPASTENQLVFTERLLLAVPARSQWAAFDEIALSRLSKEGFVSMAGNRKFRSICDTLCLKAGFAPKMVFESDSPDTVRNLIAVGCGVSFWPEYTWGKPGAGVKLLTVSAPYCARCISLCRHESLYCARSVNRSFYTALSNDFEALFDGACTKKEPR